MKNTHSGLVALLAASTIASAQTSASFRLTEHVFNTGGHPAQGITLASAGFRLSIDSLGDSIAAGSLASGSFTMSAGFSASWPPPGEVPGIDFLDLDTLIWSPEKSAGTYNLYRDLVGNLAGFGACHQQGLAATTIDDAGLPLPGEAFFYLVTVENMLAEEGTKGFGSGGAERMGTVCP